MTFYSLIHFSKIVTNLLQLRSCAVKFSIFHLKCVKNTSLLYSTNQPMLSENTEEYFRTEDLDNYHLAKIAQNSDENDVKLLQIMEEKNCTSKYQVPEFMNFAQLQILYEQPTRSQRFKYMHYLYRKEKVKLAGVEKKKRNKQIKDALTPEELDLNKHRPSQNSLILHVRKQSLYKSFNRRLANAVLFGGKIVIDLDYDQYMVEKERTSCIAQLGLLYSLNRKNCDPYDIYFCNAKSNFRAVQKLKDMSLSPNNISLNLTEKNYLDIFPSDRLVYLSPHAKDSLTEYDHNAIYIIGGFVDIVNQKPLSFDKAESERIKSVSLPLDEYMRWSAGTKSLTINQVFEIMLTLKNTGDWKKAFECIPSRKIFT